MEVFGQVSLHLCGCLLFELLLFNHVSESSSMEPYVIFPGSSASGAPQPIFPSLAPAPLLPFATTDAPKLPGICNLSFIEAENLLRMTSTDCFSMFAPYLANVVCCPQLEASLVIIVSEYSKRSNSLALNKSFANECFSDINRILVRQGASDNLQQICSIHSSNLTKGSCPVSSVVDFEGIINTSKILNACGNVDLVKECCEKTCQNAISEAARKIASPKYNLSQKDSQHILPERTDLSADCKSIVLRWLASKLSPTHAKELLRGLSSCTVNQVCPLDFPDINHVVLACGNEMHNQTVCCTAIDSYMSHIQKQKFVTNIQAMNCATLLGMKLQKTNISKNIYKLCQLSLKDFSLQASTEAAFGFQSGCLLPSLPLDLVFDSSSGVSFLCDLNDNIPAPWPSTSELTPSCNRSVRIPALPAVASSQSGAHGLGGVFMFSIIWTAIFTIFGIN